MKINPIAVKIFESGLLDRLTSTAIQSRSKATTTKRQTLTSTLQHDDKPEFAIKCKDWCDRMTVSNELQSSCRLEVCLKYEISNACYSLLIAWKAMKNSSGRPRQKAGLRRKSHQHSHPVRSDFDLLKLLYYILYQRHISLHTCPLVLIVTGQPIKLFCRHSVTSDLQFKGILM